MRKVNWEKVTTICAISGGVSFISGIFAGMIGFNVIFGIGMIAGCYLLLFAFCASLADAAGYHNTH